jgi:Protein of unknown function (DUF3987)
MDDASNSFAPLTPVELAEAARQSGLSEAEGRPPPICPPADAESGAVAAARVYGRKPDSLWRYATAEDQTAFYAARWNDPDGEKTFRPLTWREGAGWQFEAWPNHRLLFNMPDLVSRPKAWVVVCEGEKAAQAAAAIFPDSVTTTSSGGAGAAARTDWSPLAGRSILIWPDHDAAGQKYARDVATILASLDCSVSIIDAKALAAIDPAGGAREPPDKWDAADAIADWLDPAALRRTALWLCKAFDPGPAFVSYQPYEMTADGLHIEIQKGRREGKTNGHFSWVARECDAAKTASTTTARAWPQPQAIPDGLAPVAPFDMAFLPETIAPWVADIAERMQCPPDFVAIPAMVALGAVLGRKVGIRPQRRTDWTEVPNLWGCIVGRPGAMKSPAMGEALKPLHRLERRHARRTTWTWRLMRATSTCSSSRLRPPALRRAKRSWAGGTRAFPT